MVHFVFNFSVCYVFIVTIDHVVHLAWHLAVGIIR